MATEACLLFCEIRLLASKDGSEFVDKCVESQRPSKTSIVQYMESEECQISADNVCEVCGEENKAIINSLFNCAAACVIWSHRNFLGL